MEAFFQFLAANPYILLFFVVGTAVGVGRFTIKGYGLGMVASVGYAVSGVLLTVFGYLAMVLS